MRYTGSMLHIAALQAPDIEEIAAAFASLGWNKPAAQYERYVAEQSAGARIVLVCRLDDVFCGYVTINWQPDYPPFREAAIPEIQDFNVLPLSRRRGIGSRLMDEAEALVFVGSQKCGLGFGLHHDYGAAQRLYVLRGYVPDGLGAMTHGRRVNWGDAVTIDDELVLYLVKTKS